MIFEFAGQAIEWRGPAPFVFVPVPPDISSQIKAVSSQVTYGWGVVPVTVTIGATTSTTALFPRDGVYLVPIKKAVQKAEKAEVGDLVQLRLEITGLS